MTESNNPIIAVSDLRKSYGRKMVIDVVRLTLAHGEKVLLWGPNASGKSTLLRLLAGVARPSGGRIVIDPDHRHSRRALLPQTGGLYDDLTVRQNLLILSRLHGRLPDDAPFLALLGDATDAHLDLRLGTLSGGMQRLLSIAALLSLRPGFLFLDEPFAGLDTPNRSLLERALNDFTADTGLLVITEHSHDGVAEGWRRIALRDGQIEAPT
ncbi:ABC transporter ATP-binding protein [Sedimentitalea todarodis]|uniref:ATP-binding cassette domain-containing protein n=1 Tax=Sedimentitalea todarodis TaxID=1631240 RepID=A0ABU3VDX7_9RHOB|nr:ATP-binding cassette domain-containing protein [Sedimentitalea todarodis]MDU9004361.1 ATP-binding cassette domain-containing protein [Sedimentitalea todarodis]